MCVCFYVSRSKEVDWQPYFTTRLVDDFATHLRVFRKAQDRLADREDKQSKQTHSYTPAFLSFVYFACSLDGSHFVLSLISFVVILKASQ